MKVSKKWWNSQEKYSKIKCKNIKYLKNIFKNFQNDLQEIKNIIRDEKLKKLKNF